MTRGYIRMKRYHDILFSLWRKKKSEVSSEEKEEEETNEI